jgi:hypothetical protein
MSLLELRKRFLAVLLVSFMALGMAACSSTGDSDDAAADKSAPADTASGEVPPDEGFDCSIYDNQAVKDNCEDAKGIIN